MYFVKSIETGQIQLWYSTHTVKIGYPCINRTLDCSSSRTFRLKSYSEPRLIETVENNLDCLMQILRFNIANHIYFFRITSDLVPFASHPVCSFKWDKYFSQEFIAIGNFIKEHQIRISMHPGQYTLLNSVRPGVIDNSIRDLEYHARLLDAMMLDNTAKIQIHIGGVYGDKSASMDRFVSYYETLDESIKNRLAIENDDSRYTLQDCLFVHSTTGIPVILDILHHELHNNGELIIEALSRAGETWRVEDGIPMIDYSQSDTGSGSHDDMLDIGRFSNFVVESKPLNFDIMLEIKDKESSALKAVDIASEDKRFFRIFDNRTQ